MLGHVSLISVLFTDIAGAATEAVPQLRWLWGPRGWPAVTLAAALCFGAAALWRVMAQRPPEHSPSGDGGLLPGTQVRLAGLLSRPDLNGSLGTLVAFEAGKGRWQVRLTSGEVKLFKSESLELAAAPAESGVASVRVATEHDARNAALVRDLVAAVNEAYKAAMEGMVDNPARFVRTDEEDIEERLVGIQQGVMRRHMLLAFVGEEVAGCCSATVGWHGQPQLGQFGMLAVAHRFQRQGIAKQLVRAAEDRCASLGASVLQCEEMTCTDGTHEMSNWLMRFYKDKLGYSVVQRYDCPRGHHTRGARTSRDLQFLIYRKDVGRGVRKS